MRVAVSGASGFIGSALCARLGRLGHEVVRIARSGSGTGDASVVRWDPAAGRIDAGALEGCDAVVHLAGENVGLGRWTEAKKARIMDSREQGTAVLALALAGLSRRPSVLVSASAIGYYGDRGDEVLTEDSAPGTGFLAEVCRRWEAAADPARDAGIRVAHPRTGLVLDARGGVLPRLMLPFRLGLGGPLGSGRQWMSWITLEDEVSALVHLLGEQAPSGPVNLTAPDPVTGNEFTRQLGGAMHRPGLLRVPSVALRLALGGERAHDLALSSQRVLPRRLSDDAFQFADYELRPALDGILAGGRRG